MPPAPDMDEKKIDMRHSKLKAEEAALLAGELKKPSWQSKNEGIHERVSFEDSIWGFDLAGGSFYKTPLRVVHVKPDSRAEKAGIRIGDKIKRINDIDTSTLTIQEAHEIIIESGVHLKIAVTAPEDEEDSYFCYQDPTLEQGYDSDEERRREEEKARKRRIHCKVNSNWSLQWPWVSKRRVIWHESNCYLVPSKYEEKHRDKFPPIQNGPKQQDDIVLDPIKGKNSNAPTTNSIPVNVPNGTDIHSNGIKENDTLVNEIIEKPEMNGMLQIPEADNEDEEVSQSSEMVTSNSEELVSQNGELSKSEEYNDISEEKLNEDTEGVIDEVLNEVLKEDGGNTTNNEEDSIIDSILSNNEEFVTHNSESIDER
ncbi:uncharacterized protein LOC113229085 [Hyposmocoma kahamanoa]|uniref:uncharacterized protein LOC113229085 n=1 Tax=Hyposmocoma kahamanoa TaxID=1477025 RepID=UPI000E6D79CA|nr:uncharacterized protein LOC113229085 [Hyposmocoma kahamanoa]